MGLLIDTLCHAYWVWWRYCTGPTAAFIDANKTSVWDLTAWAERQEELA